MVADHQGRQYQRRMRGSTIVKLERRRLLQLGGAAVLSPFAPFATARADTGASDWPSRIVKLEVGFPPGGGMDSAGRIVANRLSELIGQQVIVENRAGAGGRIAMDALAHAPPDGYTVLITAGAPAVSGLLFASLSFDPVHDFEPVSLVGTYPNMLVVPNSSPYTKLEELIAFAKANPGKVSWASPGIACTTLRKPKCSAKWCPRNEPREASGRDGRGADSRLRVVTGADCSVKVCAGEASFSHNAYCATALAASFPANRCAARN